MTSLAAIAPRIASERRFAVCLAILVALTAVRLIGLAVSQVDLFFDESQYWAWSRELAFGYFSKPPLLAWVIAAAESVCGSGEACLRAPAPVFYLGTGIATYLAAETLYDERTGFWAALLIAVSTGVAFSSRIISTDVPLLFFWTVALLAYVKLMRGGGWQWGVLLGAAFGLGMLAKYAMIYFLLGIAGAAAIDRDARALLRAPALWLSAAVAALVMLPNIVWNMRHGFVTLHHVGDNVQGGGAVFDPMHGLHFLASQFAVFGPVLFGVFLVVLVRAGRPEVTRADRLMLCFAVPALALVTVTAFVTRANANWAAVSAIAMIIVVAAVLVRQAAWRLIAASLAIGVVAQLALLAGDANARRIALPLLAKPDVYARTMGWRALGDEVERAARRIGARTVVAHQRDVVASLTYYLRDSGRSVVSWKWGPVAEHHFDLAQPLTRTAAGPLLLVASCASPAALGRVYREVEPLGRIEARSGPTSSRTFFIYRLADPIAEIGPYQC